jgi:hypothetical protein
MTRVWRSRSKVRLRSDDPRPGHITPVTRLDSTGRSRPIRACWTCGREVPVTRLRAEHSRLVRLLDGVSPGAHRGRLVAAPADLRAGPRGESAAAVRATRPALTTLRCYIGRCRCPVAIEASHRPGGSPHQTGSLSLCALASVHASWWTVVLGRRHEGRSVPYSGTLLRRGITVVNDGVQQGPEQAGCLRTSTNRLLGGAGRADVRGGERETAEYLQDILSSGRHLRHSRPVQGGRPGRLELELGRFPPTAIVGDAAGRAYPRLKPRV